MEMGKHGISISEDANEEIDIENQRVRSNVDEEEEEEEEDNENVGVRRTYECSYCKRGFTNAQALGGHMNIHRKDKAKAKAKQYPTFSSSSCFSDSIVSNNPEEGVLISTFSSSLVPPMVGNYQLHNYDPLANPRSRSRLSQLSINDYGNSDFSMIGRRSSAVSMTEEGLGSDLSLRINSSSSRIDHQAEEEKKNDDIDLELRLGYD